MTQIATPSPDPLDQTVAWFGNVLEDSLFKTTARNLHYHFEGSGYQVSRIRKTRKAETWVVGYEFRFFYPDLFPVVTAYVNPKYAYLKTVAKQVDKPLEAIGVIRVGYIPRPGGKKQYTVNVSFGRSDGDGTDRFGVGRLDLKNLNYVCTAEGPTCGCRQLGLEDPQQSAERHAFMDINSLVHLGQKHWWAINECRTNYAVPVG